MTAAPVSVLIALGSATTRQLLVDLLESDPRLRVAGSVGSSQAAMAFLENASPDLVLVDQRMPGTDGLALTRLIMETRPLPVILGTEAVAPGDMAFRSLEAGAVACISFPATGAQHSLDGVAAANLLQTVKLMSEVRVVRRWPKSGVLPRTLAAAACRPGANQGTDIKVVGIGASTGGPAVLQRILAGLPDHFPVPILVVQHIAPGFLPGMVEWLGQTTGLRVTVGQHGVLPRAGHVYLAPDDYEMGLGPGGELTLARPPSKGMLRPSVAYLFRSLSAACGPNVVGLVLTGMGKDGAAELKEMKDRGAITIAQDKETSVVHGMPGEAIRIGGATHVVAAEMIAGLLTALVSKGPAE